LHGISLKPTPLGSGSRLLSSSVEIVQKVNEPRGALFMDRVSDFVPVGVESNLGGDVEHLQARNADGVIGHRDPQPFVGLFCPI